MKRFTKEELKEIYNAYTTKGDKTNEEIGAMLRTQLGRPNIAESTFRKAFQYWVRMNDAIKDILPTPSAITSDFDEQMETLRQERAKIQALNISRNRDTRQNARFDLFYESINNAIRTLEPPTFEPMSETLGGDNEYVLHLGDIHYGANFTSANNKYSRDIAKARFQKLLSKTMQFVISHDVRTLKILNVGDDVQGILRMSDLRINEVPVVQAVVEISQIIAEFLNKLSAVCNVEYYHISSANHGQTRPLGSRASELASEDCEKIICNYIKDVLVDNERVQVIFDCDKEYLEFEVAGFECIAEHGHRVSNPKKYLNDKTLQLRKLFSYGFLGHTHSNQCITVAEGDSYNCEVIVAPSFVGSDSYADSLNVGSKASSNILTFSPQNGHIATETFILN